MSHKDSRTFVCDVCGETKPLSEAKPLELLSEPLIRLLGENRKQLTPECLVCASCRTKARKEYVTKALASEQRELTTMEEQVLSSLEEQQLLARNTEEDYAKNRTFGDQLADNIATFGGSWRFIILFGVMMAIWIGFNTVVLLWKPFDPFPFILLNLILSCLASIQAPIIMMSQNRQEAKDRLRAEHDYQINLKAEIEIRQLHLKMDQLLTHQWERLIQIQQIQVELLEELKKGR